MISITGFDNFSQSIVCIVHNVYYFRRPSFVLFSIARAFITCIAKFTVALITFILEHSNFNLNGVVKKKLFRVIIFHVKG